MQCTCAILSPVARPAIQYFSSLFHKRQDFRKKKNKVTDHKMCFDFLYNLCPKNISHSKKNWARYGQKCTGGREVTVHRPIPYHTFISITYVALVTCPVNPYVHLDAGHKRMRLHILCDIRRNIFGVNVRKASSTALRKSSLLL